MFAIKRELKPNNKQVTFFVQSAGYSRFIYNYGLGLLQQSWSFEGVKAGDSKRLAAIKKVFTGVTKKSDKFAWCNDYSSRIYQNAFRDLAKACANWRDPKLKKFGKPQFKSKRHECSFTVDNCSGPILVKSGKAIKIPTLGIFRLKEPIPYNCISQTFTVSREADKWFVSFMVKACPIPEMKHTVDIVGIDLGIKCFASLSDGSVIAAPAPIKQAKAKLRRYQFKNRNKQIGNRRNKIKSSSNAVKYFERLRKKHKHIANTRNDFLQKQTTLLAKKYRHIKMETLNVSGMVRNHKLADAISNLGLSRFRELLTYKQAYHGHLLTCIDMWFPSSKTCSNCGHIQTMPLRERTYKCGGCGMKMDRDLNAAINIERWEPQLKT